MRVYIWSLLLACAGSPEREVRPESEAAIPSGVHALDATAALRVTPWGTDLVTEEGRVQVGGRLLGSPAIAEDGTRAVVAVQGDAFESTLVALERDGLGWRSRVLVSGGTPERPAIDAAGERVVFVWGGRGIAGLWWVAFEGGDPVPLTNHRLRREKRPGPPRGFVPLPLHEPPWFDGDTVRWLSEQGEHVVRVSP